MIKRIFTVSVVVLTIFWAVGLAAFVPTAQATAISSGDLIKASLPAVYYYGADGKRYVFPNEKTYKTWYSDFSGVKTITDGELAAITIGGNVTYRPGVKMVKITTDPKVYAVAANGTLRWVTSESIAAALYGANWNTMIDDVPDPFFVNYTVGAPINNASDYSPSAATAAATSINVDKGLAGAAGGVLSVALASDTPAAATVAAGASANFTKITLSAGNTAVKVKQLYVTRFGLSSNNDVTNIKLVNAAGATVGDVGSLGANSKALISFVPTLEIAANSSASYWIRASVGAAAPPGNTIALGISAATDVILEAGTATGAFPITGNYMSVVTLADLGVATVGQDAAVVDSQPDAGAKRVLVSEFYVQAGANENLTVETISLMESGSANTSDSANIELYSLTEGRTLGTVSAWDANARATFGNLAVVIPKGAKHIFQVYIDVVSGSGQTIDVDLTDGGDALVTVKGNTYGFYLTPAIAGLWDGQGIPGAGGQTVNTGILNVSKSIDSPATGNITQASEQALTTWDFEVRGEPAKITSLMVTMVLGGGLVVGDITNAKLVDETGTVVAGPKSIAGLTVTFTETIIVPTGTHKYTYKVDVLKSAGTIQANIAAPNLDITATGLNTRDNMTISTAAANGNVQTILGVALNVTTLTLPAARNVSAGTQDFVWATASLDASASGEDVRVSSVSARDTFVDDGGLPTANANNLTNMEVWADLTSAASSRGDEYETKVSNTVQPANSAVSPVVTAITLSQTITVPKGSFVKIAIIADLTTLADPGDTHQINISAVTATGKSTGNAPGVVYAGAGQIMTITGAGTLTVSIEASSPDKQILVSGAQKQTVFVLKLAANNVENMDIDDVLITDGGAGVVAKTWYLYSNKRDDGGSTADPIATVAPNAAGGAQFVLPDNTVIIPANSNVILTVKADVAPVDGVTVTNGMLLVPNTLILPADINVTGKSSGAVINDTVSAPQVGNAHVAYASRPTVTLNASSPSGALVPSANSLLAIFNVAAASADDISFDGGVPNTLSVEVSSVCAGAGVAGNFELRDESGNVLDTLAGTNLCIAGEYTFAFATRNFIVSKGTTKKLYIYGNTTGFTTSGDSVQLWLDDEAGEVADDTDGDGTLTNGDTITWSINLDGGNYPEGDVIFRGDIFANALVKG